MQHATSGDGTLIAFDEVGDGVPVVIVGSVLDRGGRCSACCGVSTAGLRGVTVDRRARGNSGDTAPYAPGREAEDLAAVINAIGGEAAVIGHSSGAVLALLAAAEGVPTTHLFLSEPPFRFGEGEPLGPA